LDMDFGGQKKRSKIETTYLFGKEMTV
jgi:hypothetical protein